MGDLLQLPLRHDFNPEQTHAMGEAYDLACEYVKHNGFNGWDWSEAREKIAQRIISLAERGEYDPQKLAAYAISVLKLDAHK